MNDVDPSGNSSVFYTKAQRRTVEDVKNVELEKVYEQKGI